MESDSESCSCEVLKVEIVNGETLEDKLREKLILLMAGGLFTLLVEKGAPLLATQIIKYRKRKALSKTTEDLTSEDKKD